MAPIKFVRDTGNHRVPREVIPIVRSLEKIAGVERVDYGNFIGEGSSTRPRIEPRGYDEQNKTLKIRINDSRYAQIICVRTNVEHLKSITDFIKDYKF